MRNITSLEEFQSLLRSTYKPVFVIFTASFCGPCKTIKPHFLKAAENMSNAIFALVDAADVPDIAIEYTIHKIPIIKIFVNQAVKDEVSGPNVVEFKKLVSKYT